LLIYIVYGPEQRSLPLWLIPAFRDVLRCLACGRIVEARVTGEDTAEVEFIARSRVSNAAAVRQHERSRFVREDGSWLYVDGEII